MSKEISEYDRRAIAEIHEWKTPDLSWFGQAMRVIDWPLSKASDWIFEQERAAEAITNAISGVVGLCNDAAQWSVRQEAIYDQFRDAGHALETSADLASLTLEDIDRVVGFLAAKYKGIAAVEGATTGYVGLPGIVVDVPALVTLNLRAIGEYATYYGFDVAMQQERLFAMHVLGLASSPKDAAKQVAMAQLVRIARDVATRKTWAALEEHAFVQVIQQIARAVGVRLTKAKLAQVVPAAGAAVGLGFNAYYTARVCDAAYYLYRERFLAEKYGPDVIEVTVPPPPDVGARYEETDEAIPGGERDGTYNPGG